MKPNVYDYLKVIALVTMIVDHIGYYLYPDNQRRRVYGRFAFPLFLFLVGYNMSYKWRPNLVLLAVLIQCVIWSAYLYGYPMADPMLNILWVIVLVRIAMEYIVRRPLSIQWWVMLMSLAVAPSLFGVMDYGTLWLSFAIVGMRARQATNRRSTTIAIILLCTMHILLMIVYRGFGVAMWPVLGLGLCMLCGAMSWMLWKGNTELSVWLLRDRMIVRISRHALWMYIAHLVILIVLSLVI